MKIYFCGAMRGGRGDREAYVKIIEHLKQYGRVLTEHVGKANVFKFEKGKTPEFIWKRDMSWLKESTVVIAEVTQPSLGVGYELGIAEKLNKPILCLFRGKKDKLSRMIGGNKSFQIINYRRLAEALKAIDKFICSV